MDNISVVRNALLLFSTRHLYDGRIYWYTVLNHGGTGIVRREGSVCEEIYFLKLYSVVLRSMSTDILVSFAAVIRVVTQRSSSLTAAHERDTFLSLCF